MRKNNFNIIYFLLIFFILYYGFYMYVGLTTPGGKMYIPVLNNFLNIPYWLSSGIAKCAELLLKVTGYNAYQKSALNVSLHGGRGVNIAWACIGVGVLVLWVAFIAAHKAELLYKLKWIIGGVILIFVFNILRITAIVLSFYYHWLYMQSFNAHTTFNDITYAIIIALMFFFSYRYNKYTQKEKL